MVFGFHNNHIGSIPTSYGRRLFELARVLVRLDHVTGVIVNRITASCERLRNFREADSGSTEYLE